MQRKISTLLSLALGAAIVAAPSLSNVGSDSAYDTAIAAKGGNGKARQRRGQRQKREAARGTAVRLAARASPVARPKEHR